MIKENGKEFVLKNIEFPGHSIADIEKEIKKGYVDISCRIYLEKAPCKEYELRAKKEDQGKYNPSNFFIEAHVGRDGAEEPWQAGNWFVFYVNNNGVAVVLHDTFALPEAWEHFKNEYETIKKSFSLDAKIKSAKVLRFMRVRPANIKENIVER